MKLKGVVCAGAMGAIVAMGSAVWAQGPGGPGGPGTGDHRPPIERAFGGHGVEGRWWNNPKLIEKLKLTDEQRKEFDAILMQHREKLIDLRAGVEKAELEMEPLIKSDQPNEAKILSQIDKVAQARAELEKANARYLLAIRSKLTPEQWKEVQSVHDERRMHEHEHGGPGMGDHGHQPPPPPGPQGHLDGSDTLDFAPGASASGGSQMR